MSERNNAMRHINSQYLSIESQDNNKEKENMAHLFIYKRNENDDEEYRASLDKEQDLLLGEDAFLLQ